MKKSRVFLWITTIIIGIVLLKPKEAMASDDQLITQNSIWEDRLRNLLSDKIDVHIYVDPRRPDYVNKDQRLLYFKGDRQMENWFATYDINGGKALLSIDTTKSRELGGELDNILKNIGKDKANELIIKATT